MNEAKERIKKLNILKEKVDVVLLANMDEPYKDVNFLYFSGSDATYSFFLYDFSTPKIITNNLELAKIKKESKIKKIEAPRKLFEKIKKELNGKKVGINLAFPYFLAKKLRIKAVNITEDLERIRAIKSDREIRNIMKSCMITYNIMENLNSLIKPGIYENEIKIFIKKKIIETGATEAMFDIVVNSGMNTAVPHPLNTDRKIKTNDIVMVDFGCRYKGYHSDMTRMFFLGSVNKKIRKQYETLKSILNEAKKFIETETKAEDVDIIIRKKLGKKLIHASGHGLGLLPHEKPLLSEKSKDMLEKNMVFAIEPGIYFKKYGLRIEDTVLLTRKGIKTLTK